MKYAFILNPAANNRKNTDRGSHIESLIRSVHPSALVVHSQSKGDITIKAMSLSESNDVVMVCGGDGSVNELVQGLKGSNCIGGIVPSGSGNDFARGLGLSLIPSQEIRILGERVVVDMDSVEIEVDGKHAIFQNTLGIGFDGWANHFASMIEFPSGKLKYVVAALKSIWHHKAQRYDLIVDGQAEHCNALMITLANGGVEGGGFHVAPQARPDDGYLDVVIVKPIGRFGLVWRLPFLLFRRQPTFKALVRRQCRHIVISCHDTMAAHADGEHLGLHLKTIEATLIHRSVRFFVPKSAQHR